MEGQAASAPAPSAGKASAGTTSGWTIALIVAAAVAAGVLGYVVWYYASGAGAATPAAAASDAAAASVTGASALTGQEMSGAAAHVGGSQAPAAGVPPHPTAPPAVANGAQLTSMPCSDASVLPPHEAGASLAVAAMAPKALAMHSHSAHGDAGNVFSDATRAAEAALATGVDSQEEPRAAVRQTDVLAMKLADLRGKFPGVGQHTPIDAAENLPLFADAGDTLVDASTVFQGRTGDTALDVHGTGQDSSALAMMSSLPASVQAQVNENSRLRVQAYMLESDADRALREEYEKAVKDALETADMDDPATLDLIKASSGRSTKLKSLAEHRRRRRALRSRQTVLTDGRTLTDGQANKLMLGRCRGNRVMSSLRVGDGITPEQEDLLLAQACGVH